MSGSEEVESLVTMIKSFPIGSYLSIVPVEVDVADEAEEVEEVEELDEVDVLDDRTKSGVATCWLSSLHQLNFRVTSFS